MIKEKFEKLAELRKQTTPGNWEGCSLTTTSGGMIITPSHDEIDAAIRQNQPITSRRVAILEDSYYVSKKQCIANSEYIAELHNAKPEEIVLNTCKLLQEWLDKQGHDRCWYYPEIFNQLAELYGVKPVQEPNLPPREEFREGCRKYEAEQYEEKTSVQDPDSML